VDGEERRGEERRGEGEEAEGRKGGLTIIRNGSFS
jgi:hypothetical protein